MLYFATILIYIHIHHQSAQEAGLELVVIDESIAVFVARLNYFIHALAIQQRCSVAYIR